MKFVNCNFEFEDPLLMINEKYKDIIPSLYIQKYGYKETVKDKHFIITGFDGHYSIKEEVSN